MMTTIVCGMSSGGTMGDMGDPGTVKCIECNGWGILWVQPTEPAESTYDNCWVCNGSGSVPFRYRGEEYNKLRELKRAEKNASPELKSLYTL